MEEQARASRLSNTGVPISEVAAELDRVFRLKPGTSEREIKRRMDILAPLLRRSGR